MKDSDFLRFQDKIKFTNTCWLWTGSESVKGYGRFKWDGSARGAHKFSYLWFIGPVCGEVAHIEECPNRNCVNPDHLLDLSKKEHRKMDHGLTIGSRCRVRQHLIETWDDLILRTDGGKQCRKCHRISVDNYYRDVRRHA